MTKKKILIGKFPVDMGRRDHVQRVGSLGGSHPPPEIHIPDRPSCGGRPGRPARRRQQRRRWRQPFGRGHHLDGHFHHHHAHLPRHLPSPLRRCKCQTKPTPYPISPHETKPKFLAGFSNRCRTHKNLDRKIIHVPTRFVCCYSQSIGPPPFTYFELYHQTCVSYEPPIVHDDMTRKIYKPPPPLPAAIVAHHRWSKSFASKVEFELLLISANIFWAPYNTQQHRLLDKQINEWSVGVTRHLNK